MTSALERYYLLACSATKAATGACLTSEDYYGLTRTKRMTSAHLRHHQQAHSRVNATLRAHVVPNDDQEMYTKDDNGRSSSTPAM